MQTLLISDLHLQASRPELSTLAYSLFDKVAKDCDALYILGDLFEYWIGDDACDQHAEEVAQQLNIVASHNVDIHVMHGNRDFLLGEQYTKRFNAQLIPQDTISIEIAGTPTLLLHGDTLCSDDTDYQDFRQMVRNPDWQENFLSQSVPDRQAAAKKIRDASKARGQQAHEENIADINDATLNQTISAAGVERILHGHTHRPARHHHTINNRQIERLVLGDWHHDHAVVALADDSKCALLHWDGATLSAI